MEKVTPQYLLCYSPYGNDPLFISLAEHFKVAFFQVGIIDSQSGQFASPDTRIEQRNQDGDVPGADGCEGVPSAEKPFTCRSKRLL